MDQAKEQIKAAYQDRVAKYVPIWEIIDQRWNNQLHRPIDAADFFLNPRCDRNWSFFERILTKKRNHLEQKRLNDLVYVQYNLWLRRNQLLNKRLDTDPTVLEDIDPTSDWVVESQPPEFDLDEDIGLDLDLEMEALLEHNVQLNVDPLVPSPAPSPTVAGTSSTQPQRKHITRLSQRVSATTSTVAIGDLDEEEPWASPYHSDSESEPNDVGFSSSSD
eukprot:PITA_33455